MHTQMVAKTDAGFIVENRITPNPMGVGRVVTITVQVVGRHAGPGKTRLTASLKVRRACTNRAGTGQTV